MKQLTAGNKFSFANKWYDTYDYTTILRMHILVSCDKCRPRLT